MTRKVRVSRDRSRRRLYAQYEAQRRGLQALTQDVSMSPECRHRARILLQELPRNSALCRQIRRCVLSGRSHGVYRRYRLSRLMLRHLVGQGMLTGLVKASW